MEGGQETVEATLHIVWMHAFDPSRAHFLLQAPARVLEPWLIKKIAKAICSGHPNERRRRIRHFLEPRLAFPQAFFSTLLLCDVSVYSVICNLLARSPSNRNGKNGDTNITAIFPPANGFDLHSTAVSEFVCVLAGALDKRLRNDEIINGSA
jgi:hypothetical protein